MYMFHHVSPLFRGETCPVSDFLDMIWTSDAAPAGATLVRYAAIFIELKNAYLTLSDNPTRRQSRTQLRCFTTATCGSVHRAFAVATKDEENSLDDLRVSNFRNPSNMIQHGYDLCGLSCFQRISCGKLKETVPNSGWITVWGPQQNVTIARGRFTFDCGCNFTLMVSKNDRIQNSVRLLQFIL